jgi:hypothetical protein
MTSAAVAGDSTSPLSSDKKTSWWAVAVMAAAFVVLVMAPARVWLLAAAASLDDGDVAGHYRALWVVLGLAPTAVGAVAWFALRRRTPRQRFVRTALWACAAGLLTIIPITPYVFAF